jgi:hypothetical protein
MFHTRACSLYTALRELTESIHEGLNERVNKLGKKLILFSVPYLHRPVAYTRQCVRQVVVRLFIGTQNRLVALHSALIQAHEETNNSPRSVIYRLV